MTQVVASRIGFSFRFNGSGLGSQRTTQRAKSKNFKSKRVSIKHIGHLLLFVTKFYLPTSISMVEAEAQGARYKTIC
jgi:hypothetical protein